MNREPPDKVLVVDDAEDLVVLMSMLLTDEGYRVETADNGREALEHAARELPDLILLDMKMPVMSGEDFAREFRARYGDATPIIVVSAAADAQQSARQICASGWVGKPFDTDALLSTVRQHLRAARASP